MSSRTLSVWPTNRDPSRLEIVVGIFALFMAVLSFSATNLAVSWVWLAIGFVAWMVALGPVAASSAGKRFDTWFKGVGGAGRAVAIVVAAAVIWGVGTTVEIPTVPTQNFLNGGFVAIFVFVAVEAIRARLIPN